MSDSKHSAEYAVEDNRNDLIDVGMGMIVTLGGFLTIAVIATVLSMVIR